MLKKKKKKKLVLKNHAETPVLKKNMPLAQEIDTIIKQSLIRRLKDSFLDSG